VYGTGVCDPDWKKSVVEPEMEFDDISNDIALTEGKLITVVNVQSSACSLCALDMSVYFSVCFTSCPQST